MQHRNGNSQLLRSPPYFDAAKIAAIMAGRRNVYEFVNGEGASFCFVHRVLR